MSNNNNNPYAVGDKVSYRTLRGETVLGVVVKVGRDELGEFVDFRVTSRRHSYYPHGYVERMSVNPWLSLR